MSAGERITKAHVETALGWVKAAAVSAGLTTPERAERWEIQHGSPSAGNAWRLYQFGDDEARPDAEPGDRYPYGTGRKDAAGLPEYLGWSAREAYATLRNISDTLRAVNYAREQVTRPTSEEIARDVFDTSFSVRDGDVEETSVGYILDALEVAAKAARA